MSDLQQHPPYDYAFCPLTDPAENLRILKITLSSSSYEDKVEGQILEFDEKQDLEYAALSWCWGPRDAPRTTMRITHNDQPYDFQISVALDSALKQLRRYKEEYFWIDQVCINQDDFPERNNQVRLMAKIYTRAKKVFVWLGEEREGDPDDLDVSADGGAAFRFIDTRVLRLRHFDHLVKNEDTHNDWNNMVELMKREWFSRRWVVQEIALAKDAVILCGSQRINWEDFADAVSLFNEAEEKRTVSKSIMMGKKEYGHKPRYFGHIAALSATRLVAVTNDLFRRRADHEKVALLTLEQLVSTFTAFNASEPRDTVYAVLAIAKDTMPRTSHANMRSMVASYKITIQEKFIEQLSQKIVAKSYYVNYEQPISDVFVDFIDFAISQSDTTRALDIICRPWAPFPAMQDHLHEDSGSPWRAVFDSRASTRGDDRGRDSLPSWISSITGAAYGLEPKSKRMVRKNPDTLVGLPPQRNYTAAGNRELTNALRFEQGVTKFSKYSHLDGIHYHSMFTEGFVVDKIENLRTASQKGNIPEDWAVLGRRYARDGEQWQKLPDEYWRTLVADRGKSGNPPRHYPRLINHALESHVQGDAFNTQEAIDYSDCQAVSDVLERVQSVIWNRRLMRSKGGRLGLVPKHAEKGDLIVILYGCSVPVVLRRFSKTKEEVKHEADTKLTRQQKIAARKIIDTFRKFVAKRKQERLEGKPLSPHQSTGGPPVGGSTNGMSSDTQIDCSSGDINQNKDLTAMQVATEQQNVEHVANKVEPMQEHESTRAHAKDLDTISISSERSVRMPGAWRDTPPLSRNGTDIVAPGPIFPQSVAELLGKSASASQTTTIKSTDSFSISKHVEPPLKADEYTFYQLIGECYLHGMMNGEAIPLQRSAEDLAKQRAQEGELAAVREATRRVKETGGEFMKSLKRSMTEPATKAKDIQKPEGPIEPASFIRTVFELR
ncbi:HET-domain-containing protein [Rhizodiscina lignyota]|uniref:HET-domain-containing protein n=1 Tax=Rhizodiscina lignyota TaxID=1504668 RepID=A0A9P4MEG4_9PEZI|nr:HET-domain-containing protein [Rhizodiscina lignyota]